MIQVDFNDMMLLQVQGTLLEQIFLFLDGNLDMPENDACPIFTSIFASFPAIIYTPGQTHHVPIDSPSHSMAGCQLDLEEKIKRLGMAGWAPTVTEMTWME